MSDQTADLMEVDMDMSIIRLIYADVLLVAWKGNPPKMKGHWK
jgi:hypothetical protein